VLRGYSEMLQHDKVVKDNVMLSQLVSGIYSGSVRMHEIVNSMLDIAKIDSHALHLGTEPLAMDFLIMNVIGKFENALKQRNLTLTTQDLADLPSVEGDPEALQKVFYHLIGNAIKYTPDGGQITVAGRALGVGEMGFAGSGIEIVVSDTGIGIDPAMHELIFIKFYQTGEVALHSTGKTKFKGGGPGLGLPIAQGIVQAHGGKLWVESPGHDEVKCPGSHFHLVLPIRQQLAVAK
jgi:signal transduction histidine kinase